jgi:phage portal protein BeeE
MDLLAQLFAGGGTPGPPTIDFWYQPVGGMTAAGMRVDAEGAKKISAWFRGRDILATALAMLPLKVYSVLPDDKGAEVASTHPLHDVLSRKPNAADDAFTWKRRAMFDIIDTGHAYNWIQIGRAWSLDRIDPRCVTFERIKSGAHKGRLLYYVRDEVTGQTSHAYAG